jgi:hypothetical protein
MGAFDFEMLKDCAVIAAKQTLALPDTRAAWPKIAQLANTFDEPGYKIPVRDETGGIVILIGVATLRRLAQARGEPNPAPDLGRGEGDGPFP